MPTDPTPAPTSAPTSLDPKRDHSAHGRTPIYRASDPDSDVVGPLGGSESSSTVNPSPNPAEVSSPGQDGDLVDGSEGSATGSRTPGHEGH
jgi:hypothetical protein